MYIRIVYVSMYIQKLFDVFIALLVFFWRFSHIYILTRLSMLCVYTQNLHFLTICNKLSSKCDDI